VKRNERKTEKNYKIKEKNVRRRWVVKLGIKEEEKRGNCPQMAVEKTTRLSLLLEVIELWR